ncbi:MAG TPA: DUF1659 domain-containing protein [Tissierellaceae bacterium]|nr:DUF1659 domain-containing protein [Tissierellaceae bacterium]
MAIVSIKEKTALRLELDNGMVDGRQRVLSKTFSKIKDTAEDEDLHGTALVLGNLQNKDLLRIRKIEETLLEEE